MPRKPTAKPKYLDWVREQPCAYCHAPGPNHAHHIKGVGHFSGVGMKAPDWLTIPLCHVHHDAIHHAQIHAELQWEWICRILDRAFREGVVK